MSFVPVAIQRGVGAKREDEDTRGVSGLFGFTGLFSTS